MHVRRPIMFGTSYFEVYVRHNTLKKGDNVCSSTVEHKLGAEHNLGADHFGAELTSFWYKLPSFDFGFRAHGPRFLYTAHSNRCF